MVHSFSSPPSTENILHILDHQRKEKGRGGGRKCRAEEGNRTKNKKERKKKEGRYFNLRKKDDTSVIDPIRVSK